MRHFRSKIFLGALVSALVMSGFQNCGLAPGFTPVSVNLPFNHPSIEDRASDQETIHARLIIGDRGYLESVFRQVFAPQGVSQAIREFVEAVMHDEFVRAQSVLGQPCNPLESGSGAACEGLSLNMKISPAATSSSIREAARIQVCRRLVENDVVLAAVVNRISNKNPSPTPASASAVVRLFFPNSDAAEVDAATEKLLKLDEAMAAATESLADRWRLAVLATCESPDWQVL